jgi:hypothetical protein
MEKVQSIKSRIMNDLEKLHFVKSITPLGRHYKKLNGNISTVNDIDIHIYVDDRTNKSCNILLTKCISIVKEVKNLQYKVIVGIYEGPYKPAELKDKKTFLFHLIVDDSSTLKKRKNTSFPTLVSWSKYEPFYGNNFIRHYVDRRITKNDILLSRFGLQRCVDFIENECVSMEYFDLVENKYQTLEYKLSGYYFFYFIFYSLMQSVRNYLRFLQKDIEYQSDIETAKIFIESFFLINSSALLEIVNEMMNIRKTSFITSKIDIIFYKKSILKILNEISSKIKEDYE